eukprot:CAMPEP_0114227834 /NCGR_PEP_ID=MMETSP0058-20121206/2006_1 /TAXON_ID=36894 /ORGANISM="Pyramimonas parkeae, CCMP726" /LENGTH=279 /DNA_ID=CAMNT_0001338711 /DNA_START=812 /DNA_END=1651 /DNA_ORIENTATION=+
MAQITNNIELLTRPFLLASFPRQGTDWFIECLNLGPAYYREFFNPLCTPPRHRDKVAAAFGSEARIGCDSTKHYWINIARPLSISEWQSLCARTWDISGFMATKEVFSPTKLLTLSSTFVDTCVLYRHRKHTFPTSRPDYIVDFYRSLELWDTNIGVLDQWKKFYPSNTLGQLGSMCAAHIACSYANLHHAAATQAPPIVYEHLVRLSPDALVGYLHCRLPVSISAQRVAQRVVLSRKDKAFLYERERRYKELAVEEICQPMVQRLIAMDPSLDLSLLL